MRGTWFSRAYLSFPFHRRNGGNLGARFLNSARIPCPIPRRLPHILPWTRPPFVHANTLQRSGAVLDGEPVQPSHHRMAAGAFVLPHREASQPCQHSCKLPPLSHTSSPLSIFKACVSFSHYWIWSLLSLGLRIPS